MGTKNISPPDQASAEAYKRKTAVVDKFLQADGSVTTGDNRIIEPPNEAGAEKYNGSSEVKSAKIRTLKGFKAHFGFQM